MSTKSLEGRYLALNLAFRDIKSKYLRQKEVSQFTIVSNPTAMVNGPICCNCSILKKQLADVQKKYHNHSSDLVAIEKSLSLSEATIRELKYENLQLTASNHEIRKQNDKLKEVLLERSASNTKPFELWNEEADRNHDKNDQTRKPDDGVLKWRCHRSLSHPVDGGHTNPLSKQIEILTMEKKQLMTNVHWLNNEIAEKDEELKKQRVILSKCNGSDVRACSSYTSMQGSYQSSMESNFGSLEEGGAPSSLSAGNFHFNHQPQIRKKLNHVTSQLVILKQLLTDGKNESLNLKSMLMSQKENISHNRIMAEHINKYRNSISINGKDTETHRINKLDLTPITFDSHHNLDIV